jgi:hypothetical protein
MWKYILLDVQGAVLALVVQQLNTNLSPPQQARAKPELITPQAFSMLG